MGEGEKAPLLRRGRHCCGAGATVAVIDQLDSRDKLWYLICVLPTTFVKVVNSPGDGTVLGEQRRFWPACAAIVAKAAAQPLQGFPSGVAAVSRRYGRSFKDVVWVLAVASQGGLSIALPVLSGLAVGYWADTRFDTLPWFTLVLTLIGAAIGPIITYRWVISSVQRRLEKEKDQEES